MVDVETKLDPKTLAEAINFAQEHYTIHKTLPTIEDFKAKFPNAQITPELISGHLNVDQIKNNEAENGLIKEDLKEETRGDEKDKLHKRNKFLGRESDEIREKINYLETEHGKKLKADISQSLQKQVEAILPKVGYKGDKQTSQRIAAEIADGASQDILSSVPHIQDFNQTSRLIADSIAANLASHPQLEQLVSKDKNLLKKIAPSAGEILSNHQDELQKAAVLGSLAQVMKLRDQNFTSPLIQEEVERAVYLQHPLATQEEIIQAKTQSAEFLQTYLTDFKSQVYFQVAQGKVPNFSAYQKIQNSSFEKALNAYTGKKDWKSRNLSSQALAQRLSGALGLKPLSLEQVEILGLGGAEPKNLTFAKAAGFAGSGVGFAINSKKGELESYFALLTHDKARFEKQLNLSYAEVKGLQKVRNLNPHQLKNLQIARQKLALFQRAYNFDKLQGRKAKTYRQMWASVRPKNPNVLGSGLSFASDSAWQTTNAFLENRFAVGSQSLVSGGGIERVLAERTHGGLAFSLGDFIPRKPLVSNMGMSVATKGMATSMGLSVASRIGRKLTAGFASLMLGAGIYFYMLGKAAFTGFVIGAAIGMGAGAAIGVAVALPFGPFAPVVMLITVPLGATIGGAVLGIAGGLIAAGLFTNSTTMVTVGVGAGIGGVVGTAIGATLGASIGGALLTPIGLTPIGALIGGMIGASVGAVVGSVVGGAIGYAIGHYVIPAIGMAASAGLGAGLLGFMVGGPLGFAVGFGIGWLAAGGWGQLKSFFSGAAGIPAGAATGIFGAISSVATGIWGGVTSVAGGLLGGLGAAANFIVGAAGAISVPFGTSMLLTVGTVAGIGGLGIVGAINQNAMWFNPETDAQAFTTGDNDFYTIVKTANPDSIDNLDLPKDVEFKITLATKDKKITQITLTDTIEILSDSTPPAITQTTDGKPISPPPCDGQIPAEMEPNQTRECRFSIHLSLDYKDSLITNTVMISALPEGETSATRDQASAFVVVGSPPQDCPHGWPTAAGTITQGPEGAASHAGLSDPNERAIDIAGATDNGTPANATFGNGHVIAYSPTDNGDFGIYVDIQGICEGHTFIARYAHLKNINGDIALLNAPVSFGQLVGKVDATGYVLGDNPNHLHYSFIGLEMQQPNIPITLSDPACDGFCESYP